MKPLQEKIDFEIPSSKIRGKTRVFHLARYWAKAMARRNSNGHQWMPEAGLDQALLDCLGLGLEVTVSYLYQYAPTFQEFEEWILGQTSLEDRVEWIDRYNKLFEKTSPGQQEKSFNFLPESDLKKFEDQGYLVVKQAISKDECAATIKVIAEHLGIDPSAPGTWYNPHPSKQGIMVQLFRHKVLDQNRLAPKIRNAYESLWKTDKLWVSIDRAGFNPPETATWKFPGPNLHLDIIPTSPFPFGLQGILYLTDTAENQGALTLVPGFHKHIETWMNQFEPGNIPLIGVFDEFEKKPIAGEAGDFIIWHRGLPHGSSPNTHTLPRIVQYINFYPVITTTF